MTTTQSGHRTGQPSTPMVVAGQPNTFVGQIREDETLYFTYGRQGNHPMDPGRVINFREFSSREIRDLRKVYDYSMAKGEQDQLFTRFFVDEPESSWYRASLGDVRVADFEGSQWVVAEQFARPLPYQRPWLGARSFVDNVYQWSPGLAGTQISFGDIGQRVPDANRPMDASRGQERLVNYAAWVLTDPPRYHLALGLIDFIHVGSGVYEKRIETLRGLAADEEITVNDTSVGDFRYFVGSVVPSENAQLIVMDNGNLRAVWKNDDAGHLGLQFLGDQQVQYVVFRKGGPEGKVYRLAGESSFDEMRKTIEVWGLSSLMSA